MKKLFFSNSLHTSFSVKWPWSHFWEVNIKVHQGKITPMRNYVDGNKMGFRRNN